MGDPPLITLHAPSGVDRDHLSAVVCEGMVREREVLPLHLVRIRVKWNGALMCVGA